MGTAERITAIISITTITIVALLKGYDSVLLATALSVISGLAGYWWNNVRGRGYTKSSSGSEEGK